MPILSATYKLEIPTTIRCKNMDKEWRCDVNVDDFGATLTMTKPVGGPAYELADGTHVQGIDRLAITVSRNEASEPPMLGADGKDFGERAKWFTPLTEEYQDIALLLGNRFVDFLRLRMFVAKLSPFRPWAFFNPVWKDGDGNVIETGTIQVAGSMLQDSGDPKLLGERDLTAAILPELTETLRRGYERVTYEEFLADAKTSIVEDKLERGVLEMAIAMEILTKRTFFAAASPASAAIDYLEDKRSARIQVKELLDKPAKQAFGESLRECHPNVFRDLDHLFRCRNKVAHRGELVYRDDQDNEHVVDRLVLQSWWASVEVVVNWIAQKTGTIGLLNTQD